MKMRQSLLISTPPSLSGPAATADQGYVFTGQLHLFADAGRILAKSALVAFLLAQVFLQTALATSRTWTGGGANALWSNPNNWNPAGAPADGDSLTFPSSASRPVNTNDLPGLQVQSLVLSGSAGGITLRGNTLLVGSDITATHASSIDWVEMPVEFPAGGAIASAQPGTLVIRSNVLVGGSSSELILESEGYTNLLMEGAISGNCDVVKIGDGVALFTGVLPNTYSGTTYARGGELRLGKSGANRTAIPGPLVIGDNTVLDSTVRDVDFGQYPVDINVTVSSNGVWDLAFGAIVSHLTLLGGEVDGGGTLSLDGDVFADEVGFLIFTTSSINCPIDLGAQTRTFEVYGGDLQLGGNIVGASAAGLNLNGAFIDLYGSNSYPGLTVVSAYVIARNNHALGAAGSGAETMIQSGGSLTFYNGGVCDEDITFNGGTIDALGFGDLELPGSVTVLQPSYVYASSGVVLSGGVTGAGSLDVIFGRVRVTGTSPNTLAGGIYLQNDDTNFFITSLELAKPAGVSAVGGHLGVGRHAKVSWLADSQLNGASVSATDEGLLDLNNHADTLGDVTFFGSGNISNMNFMSLTGAVNVATGVFPNNLTVNLSGLLVLPGNISFNVSNTVVEPAITLSGSIQGAGGFTKNGPATMRIASTATYSGPVTVTGGLLQAGTDTALGGTSAGTTVLDGATLQIETSPALAEPLNLSGAGRGGTNGALYLGPATGVQAAIVLDADATVRNDISFAILSGVISGPGGLTKTGAGALQLGGGSGSPNTYSGDTVVAEGLLVGSKGAGVTTVPGHLIIGTGAGGPAATFRNFSSFTIVGSVTVNQNGLWDLLGQSEGFSVPALEGHPPLTLNGGGDVQTGAGIVYLPVGGDVVVTPAGVNNASSSISGNLGLDPGPHHFNVGNAFELFTNTDELVISAVISETSTAADIVKDGTGDMRLTGNNSFSGSATVNAGTLIAANNSALGTSAGGTIVNSNASLALDGGLDIVGESLTLNSTNANALLSLGVVTNVWDDGPIHLQQTAGIDVDRPGGVLTHSGVGSLGSPGPAISGAGGLTKSGPGTLLITGLIGGNSYTGPTTITDGTLEATRAGRSLSDSILVTGSNSVLRTGRAGTLFTSVTTVLPTGASMTVENGATWTMSPTNSETLSRLAGDGQLQTGTSGTLTISNGVSCAFSGIVSGSVALSKRGPATLQFTSPYSYNYTGVATVFDGTYMVDGDFRSSPVTVKPAAILRGGGTLGDVTVEPGGVVKVDERYTGVLGGVLGMNSVDFQSSGAVLGLDFYGPDPTGGNDQLYVNDAVTLGNVNLSAGFLYPPHEGDVVTLITKTTAGAVSGTIGGMPEGSLQMIGQIPVVVSYVGGDGNDVTLTVTNLPLGGGGAEVTSGNNGTSLTPDDCGQLWLEVTNRSGSPIGNLHATLRSLTPGLIVTIAESDYPDLAPGAAGTNVTPFQVRTEPGFPCGGGAQFELELSTSNLPPLAVVYTLPGASGYHLDFDGLNDRVDVAANTFAGVVNNFTIELWANPTGTRTETAETNNGISGFSAPLHQAQRFAVFPDRGDIAYGLSHVGAGLSIGKNGISAYEQGTNFVEGSLYLPSRLVYSNALSGWTHVALVYASRQPRLYVNGVLERAGAAGPFPNIHPSASLGGSVQGSYGNFKGQLDEVRIWNVALSQSQIQSNMLRSLTGTEPGLVAYFRCDEGGGSVLTDSAPASPNPSGALANGAAFVLSDRPTACTPGAGECESCYTFNGTFTSNAPTLAIPLSAEGSPSICSLPKPCPGPFPLPLPPTPYHLYHFTNTSEVDACVTAQLHFDCPDAPNAALHAAAYLGSLDTNDCCANYLGDSGAVGTQPFSFPVPAGSNFVIVLTLRVQDIGCDDYTLELFGLPCPPPTLAIDQEADPDQVRIHWSTAYPDYRAQEAGSPSQAFGNVADEPAIVNGRYSITNIPMTTNRFYRLFKP